MINFWRIFLGLRSIINLAGLRAEKSNRLHATKLLQCGCYLFDWLVRKTFVKTLSQFDQITHASGNGTAEVKKLYYWLPYCEFSADTSTLEINFVSF